MRDVVAGLVAIGLVIVALRMATALQWHRRDETRRRRNIAQQGQAIIAEIPSEKGVEFFTADEAAFYWSGRRLPRTAVTRVRLLMSGVPIATREARRGNGAAHAGSADVDDQPAMVDADRWDVAIDVVDDTVLVECGAIRERVSQELAREVFAAVAADLEAPAAWTPRTPAAQVTSCHPG